MRYQSADIFEGNEIVDGGKPKVIISTGEIESIKCKAVYFMRTIPTGRTIKLEVATDNDLLMGEVSAGVLESFSSSLKQVFLPLIQSNTEWGACSQEQTKEFKQGFGKFVGELEDAISSMNDGIALKTIPDAVRAKCGDKNNEQICKDSDVVAQFESLLGDWCRQIEAYLEESLEGGDSSSGADPGPRSEFDYWCLRMQKITSITEQLKSKDCKLVFGVLHAVTRDGNKVQSGQSTQQVKMIGVNYGEGESPLHRQKYTIFDFVHKAYCFCKSTITDQIVNIKLLIKLSIFLFFTVGIK